MCLAMQRSRAWKLGDGCGWDCMLARVGLWVEGGWVVGSGSRMCLSGLGKGGPSGCGWDLDGGSSIVGGMNCFRGMVRHLGGMGELVLRLLSFVLERLADISAVAEDMSAIASARWLMA